VLTLQHGFVGRQVGRRSRRKVPVSLGVLSVVSAQDGKSHRVAPITFVEGYQFSLERSVHPLENFEPRGGWKMGGSLRDSSTVTQRTGEAVRQRGVLGETAGGAARCTQPRDGSGFRRRLFSWNHSP